MICTFFPYPALVPEIVSTTAYMLIEQIVVGVSNKCHYNRTAYFVTRSSSVFVSYHGCH